MARSPDPLQRTSSALPPSSLSRKSLGGSKTHPLAIFVALGLLVVAHPAVAKCAWTNYLVRAAVRDHKSQSPLAGVSLAFFADDESEAWLLDWTETKPERYLTDETGRFEGLFRLSTYSGWFPTDRCNRRLKRLTVVATKVGYRGRRFVFKAAKLPLRIAEHETAVDLPILELEPVR